MTHEERIAQIKHAIDNSQCYIETAWGKRRVQSYNSKTGWTVTNNRSDFLDQRSFMVCASDFIFADEPIANGAL